MVAWIKILKLILAVLSVTSDKMMHTLEKQQIVFFKIYHIMLILYMQFFEQEPLLKSVLFLVLAMLNTVE